MQQDLPFSHSFITKMSLFSLGGLLNCFFSADLNFLFAAILFFTFGWVITASISIRKGRAIHAFELTFCILLFASTISSFYLNVLDDKSQLFGDSGFFYREAIGQGDVGTRYFIGGIVLFTFFYDTLNFIGFEKEIYIGILANITAGSLASVVTLACLDKVVWPYKKVYCYYHYYVRRTKLA